nr:hypothetical protein CFP56_76133 [Quercus suber]
MPEFSGPSPSTKMNPVMEVDTREEIFNADVTPDVSASRTDGDLTNETQVNVSFSSPLAAPCQPIEVYAIPEGGDSLLGDLDAISKLSNSGMLPKNSGTFADGDPFLAKLQEIDSDLKKFDHEPRVIPGDLIEPASSLDGLVAAQAYKLLATSDWAVQPTYSSSSRGKTLWKGIWNLQVPQKVKHLIWRAANEAIPTLLNLWKRRVVNFVCCPMCKSDTEDTTHAMWGCNFLAEIWNSHDGLKKIVRFNFCVFSDLLEVVFHRQSSVDVDVLAMMFWLIWNNRNAKRCGGAITKNYLIRSKAESMINEFRSAHGSHRKPSKAVACAVRMIPPAPQIGCRSHSKGHSEERIIASRVWSGVE